MAAAKGEERFICRSRWWKCTENEKFMKAPRRLRSLLEWNSFGSSWWKQSGGFCIVHRSAKEFTTKSVPRLNQLVKKYHKALKFLYKANEKRVFKFWNISIAFATSLPFMHNSLVLWKFLQKENKKFIRSLLHFNKKSLNSTRLWATAAAPLDLAVQDLHSSAEHRLAFFCRLQERCVPLPLWLRNNWNISSAH